MRKKGIKSPNQFLKDSGKRRRNPFYLTSHLNVFLSYDLLLSFSESSFFSLTSRNISVQSSVVGLREDFASEW